MTGAIVRGVHGTVSSMLDLEQLAPERIRPLHRSEYERLVDAGAFEHEHVELLHGALVAMSPQGGPHAAITARIGERLIVALRGRAEVRCHSPFAASGDSMPEPDVQVVPRGSRVDHPRTAFLVVEVADSSLGKDRRIKAGIYADAGVPAYWIVDVAGEAIEVHTAPAAGAYTRMVRVERGGGLGLDGFADLHLCVDDFF